MATAVRNVVRRTSSRLIPSTPRWYAAPSQDPGRPLAELHRPARRAGSPVQRQRDQEGDRGDAEGQVLDGGLPPPVQHRRRTAPSQRQERHDGDDRQLSHWPRLASSGSDGTSHCALRIRLTATRGTPGWPPRRRRSSARSSSRSPVCRRRRTPLPARTRLPTPLTDPSTTGSSKRRHTRRPGVGSAPRRARRTARPRSTCGGAPGTRRIAAASRSGAGLSPACTRYTPHAADSQCRQWRSRRPQGQRSVADADGVRSRLRAAAKTGARNRWYSPCSGGNREAPTNPAPTARTARSTSGTVITGGRLVDVVGAPGGPRGCPVEREEVRAGTCRRRS